MVFTKNVGLTVRMQWLHSIRGPRKETPSKSPLIFVECEWQQLGWWWVDMYRCIQSIWGVCEDDRWQVQGTLPKRGPAANHRAAPRARVDTRAGKIATCPPLYLSYQVSLHDSQCCKVLSNINIRAAKTDWSGRRKSWTFRRLIFSICLHCGVAKNCTDLNTQYQLQQRTSSLPRHSIRAHLA